MQAVHEVDFTVFSMEISMSTSAWAADSLQFPRLLAEIQAVGLTEKQIKAIALSMDLTREHVMQLFSRGEAKFEVIKKVMDARDGV